jgi:ankyrin repeat protein
MTITTSPAGEVQETLSGGICQTAVTWAALGGNAEIVQLLLDAGASPAGCEVTALEAAKAEHHQKVVDLLVARGVKE